VNRHNGQGGNWQPSASRSSATTASGSTAKRVGPKSLRYHLFLAVQICKQVKIVVYSLVVVGHQRALGIAVKDWFRTPRYTALGALLAELLTFSCPRATSSVPGEVEENSVLAMPEARVGLLEDATA
jgi:hypothetical protein